ncbi:VQ motif-containing protein 11-like [Solanum lycopersicum]|uniref:VQ motif-containing protein 11-like n=1 Tax=Solanum lycopersicum TaxID=4081 RepID=UPI00374842F5
MTSTSKNNKKHNNSVMNISSNNNNNNNTTFVQADPSNFRSVVQKLTSFESNKFPTIIDRTRSSTFNLHKRRHNASKVEYISTSKTMNLSTTQKVTTSSSSFLASPISPLDVLTRGISPRSTMDDDDDEEEEEERAIAEKRFYLHPNTPRASQTPQLLSLFPLQSPKDTHHS